MLRIMDTYTNKRRVFAEILLVALLAVGILDSIKLFIIDVELWGSIRDVPSFCNVSELINCDAVSMSSYSMILGVSNSLFGILYYFFLLSCAIFSFFTIDLKLFFKRFVYVCSAASIIANIFLAYISIFEIGSICLLCWLSYLLNIGIFALSWTILGESPVKSIKELIFEGYSVLGGIVRRDKRELAKASKLAAFLGILCVVTIIAFIKINGLFQERTRFDALTAKEVKEYYDNLPSFDIPVTRTVSSWGSKAPKVTVVEFSDFMCPFCRRGAFLVKNLLKEYEPRVELVFKNYPIDSACNRMVGKSIHPRACLLSKAAICADKRGKFWRFHDIFFEDPDMTRGDILELAEREGMDRKEFEDCLDSQEVQRLIDKDVDDAVKLNINATPSFLINGRLLVGLPIPKVFKLILEQELKK